MRKFLIYIIFAIASLVIAATFVTSDSYLQLAIAVILYPLLIFFAYKLFICKKHQPSASMVHIPATKTDNESSADKPETEEETNVFGDITDIDKRDFLKMIGAAGISFFLFSIFNRRTQPLFSENTNEKGTTTIEDTSGNKINPAVEQPTDSYIICEIDEGYVSYYGFTNKDGGWYIMREDPDVGSFRYTKGETDFTTNWAEREKLNYDYYHNIF